MGLVKLTSLDVRGTQIEVFVNDRNGTFSAELDGKALAAATLEELRTRLMTETRKRSVKVAIPFSMLNASRFGDRVTVQHGNATGRHAGNGSILVAWATGHKEQLSAYTSAIMRPLDAAESAELIRLKQADIAATRALDTFIREHKIDLGRAVDDAIAEAIK